MGAIVLVKPKAKTVPAVHLRQFADDEIIRPLRAAAGFPAINMDTPAVLKVFADLKLPVFDNKKVDHYLGAIATRRNHPPMSPGRFLTGATHYVQGNRWTNQRNFSGGTWYARWLDVGRYERAVPQDILESIADVREGLKTANLTAPAAFQVGEVAESDAPRVDRDPFIRLVYNEANNRRPTVVVFGVWDEPDFARW